MQFQRISPTELLVLAPVEEVREAAWHTLWNERIQSPLIDVQKNLVSGAQGDGILTPARVVSANFEERSEGILVAFDSSPVIGSKDVGAKGREKKLANTLEQVLAAHDSFPSSIQSGIAPAPIADPSSTGDAPLNLSNQPLYGATLSPKKGVTILCYGILSLILCQILGPITLMYGFGALKEYEREGDPGDKGLIHKGMAVSGVACLLLIALFVMIFM